ncbi:MAG TPA: 30S ribosomal protein S15 [Candidatus Bathyarchaeia archaeon]|nr:30S ribosomal protein S15 [Candidatus Bathyarchaeia archaeon]
MARMHAHTRGKSHSVRPTSKNSPVWLTRSPAEVTTIVIQLSKEGLTPTTIGTKMRDEYGIPLVKNIMDKSITEIRRENGFKDEMPEDLHQLVQKALALQKHLRSHNTDHRNVRSLELIEAKIHRLSKYYKRNEKIPKDWKYSSVIAQLE